MGDRREDYAEYLKSEEWALRRDLVMARAKNRCEGCGLRAASEVHHLTYEHVTQEFLFELVALCGDCHERAHAPAEQARPATWKPRLAGTPNVRVDRQRLAELAGIHRRKWMAMTDEERLEQTKRAQAAAPHWVPAVRKDRPHDDIPEAMGAEP